MSLIDKINSVPLKVAEKIVKKTGKSKYSLAQICNFAAGAPSLYVTIAAYNNGDKIATFVGGAFTLMQALYTYSNPKRKEFENPKFIEKTAEELSDKVNMGKDEIKEKIQANLNALDYFEKKSAASGFWQTINAALMGLFSGMVYAQAGSDERLQDYGMYLGLFSVTLLFSGLAHYFRAVQKK